MTECGCSTLLESEPDAVIFEAGGASRMAKQRRKDKTAIAAQWKGPWLRHFFQRHPDDHPTRAVPARDFLDGIPEQVAAKFIAVIDAVAGAPPPNFSGGGYWEAMHGEMSGYYEIRIDDPERHHYRLFVLLERNGGALGLGGPSLVLIAGLSKPFRTTLSAAD